MTDPELHPAQNKARAALLLVAIAAACIPALIVLLINHNEIKTKTCGSGNIDACVKVCHNLGGHVVSREDGHINCRATKPPKTASTKKGGGAHSPQQGSQLLAGRSPPSRFHHHLILATTVNQLHQAALQTASLPRWYLPQPYHQQASPSHLTSSGSVSKTRFSPYVSI